MRRVLAILPFVACSCAGLPPAVSARFTSPEGYAAGVAGTGGTEDRDGSPPAPPPPLPRGTPPRAGEEGPEGTLTPLTPEDALRYAWRRHPRMLQLRSLVAAAEGDRLQAGLRPNPELGVALRDEADMKRVIGLTLSQKLETGRKRRARVLASAAVAGQARAEHAEAWADVRAGVKLALARLAYARESLALHRRLLAVREETLELVGSLAGAGKVSQVDLLKARERTALARAALAERSASAAASQREARLAIGLPPAGEGPKLDCSPEAVAHTSRGFDALVKLARGKSPLLASAGARRAVMEARVVLSRAGRVPDVTLGAGVGRIDLDSGGGRDEFRFGLSGELPLFDRNQGAIAAARHRLRAASRAEEVAAIDVASALSALLTEYEARRAEAAALRDTVLPAAEQRLAYAKDEMEAGKASRLEYLEREGELLQLRLRHARAAVTLALAAVRLERVAGLLVPSG